MKLTKIICKNCNSIEITTLIKVPKEFYKPIKKEIKMNLRIIDNLRDSLNDLFPNTTNIFTGRKYQLSYDRIVKILNKMKERLELDKEMLKYNYYYKCSVCKEKIYLKIKND